MNATSAQIQSNAAKQQHEIALDMDAAETCRRSPNLDRLDTNLLIAKLHAARSAERRRILHAANHLPYSRHRRLVARPQFRPSARQG